jgi:hypothetical protein
VNHGEDEQLFKDEVTDRDETTAVRAALDIMPFIQVDEGAWWHDDEDRP